MKYKKRGGKVLTLRQQRSHAQAQAQAQARAQEEAERQQRAAVRAETERRAAEWSLQDPERAVRVQEILARRAARAAEEAATAPYGGTRKYKHKRTRARRTCARTRRAK